MRAVHRFGTCRSRPRRYRQTGLLLLLIGVLVQPTGAVAHGVDYRIEYGEAVMVHFTSHHGGAMAGAGFRVFSPTGRAAFVSGETDALGRAVFVPNQPGQWRVLMATEDGHGAEVDVPVSDKPEYASAGGVTGSFRPASGRVSATAAGIGYLFGIAGLLALWRLRR